MYQGFKKYIPFQPVSLPDRTWPHKAITKATQAPISIANNQNGISILYRKKIHTKMEVIKIR